MRITVGSGIRSWWMDRNPTFKGFAFAVDAQAPIAQTTEWTYTVPTLRKALLTTLQVAVKRQTVATTADRVAGGIQFNDGVTSALLAAVVTYGNAIDSGGFQNTGQSCLLGAAQTVNGLIADLSTGGTCSYRVTMSINEFDA